MAKKDRLKVGPEMPCGHRPYIRQHPDGTKELGVGALVPDGHEVIHEQRESSGPAKVTTEEYRAGWDNIFGQTTVGQA